jgi:hypothetical protein
MNRALILASLALGGCVAPVRGEPASWNRVVLVELFTSQGCSSCPTADALVRQLPSLGLTRDKVLPLTYHVSYWDDLGWKDPFSSPAFTARQQWYADTGKLRSPDVQASAREIYTPQMVVGGTVHFSGARRNVALSQLRAAAAARAPLKLAGEAKIEGDVAVVTIGASGSERPDPSWRLFVALALRSARTPVASGENVGRTLEEADVVRSLTGPLPLRPGQANVVRVAKPATSRWADLELVAFVQSLSSLEIAGATAVNLPP